MLQVVIYCAMFGAIFIGSKKTSAFLVKKIAKKMIKK